MLVIEAVVFDLDGVLVDSESLWDEARRTVAAEFGGHWAEGATAAMQGMSSIEWSTYMRDRLGVDLSPPQINFRVVERLLDGYRQQLPLLPGAVEAVHRIGARWTLGVASSANRVVLDCVLDLASLAGSFNVTVSSEEVARGKPAPDVYLEAARRLAVDPRACAAVEDSTNGIRSAEAAGLRVIAVPNHRYPPSRALLKRVPAVLRGLHELTVPLVTALELVTIS